MRTNGKRTGTPTRPHETVAVSPSPAFIKWLASPGPCWYTYGGDVFIAGSLRMMAIDYASRIATESETACVARGFESLGMRLEDPAMDTFD